MSEMSKLFICPSDNASDNREEYIAWLEKKMENQPSEQYLKSLRKSKAIPHRSDRMISGQNMVK